MKDKPFLSGIISDATHSALEAVANAPASSFGELVKIAGLDHTRDLRHSDLRNIDLSHSDLRGFDLTGADLRGATGINVKWDDTTVLEGAELGDSIFAAKVRLDELFTTDERAGGVFRTVAREGWAGQLIWAGENLVATGRHRDIAVPITEALFYRAKDDFLKASLMRYVAPRLASETARREMLLTAISEEPDSAVVVGTSLSLFRRYGMSSDASVRQIVRSLMDSTENAIRAEAVQFIMRTHPTDLEIAAIRDKAEAGNEQFSILYVAETARRLGDAYDLVTRDPVSNATLPLNSEVTPTMRNLIARRWLRAEASRGEQERKIPLAQRRRGSGNFEQREIDERAKQVDSMWARLAQHGVVFSFARDRIENSPFHGELAFGGGGSG